MTGYIWFDPVMFGAEKIQEIGFRKGTSSFLSIATSLSRSLIFILPIFCKQPMQFIEKAGGGICPVFGP